MRFDWHRSVAYDATRKKEFHNLATRRLRQLAGLLGFDKADYDLRSNMGGVAVSGEVTLHHERVYIQAAQSAIGADSGILIRTCEGRKDYTGGPNHFASLSTLDDLPQLVRKVKTVMPEFRSEEFLDTLTDDETTAYYRRLR